MLILYKRNILIYQSKEESKMKLYLSSYRVGNNTEELIRWLESHDKEY